MNQDQPWYAVRCLFRHPTRVREGDGHLYEERITIWRCGSWDEAYRQARIEAMKYAGEAEAELIDTTDAFHLFDEKLQSGTEVWAMMRGSHLDPHTYTNTFCTTPRDRRHDYTGPS